MELGHGVNSFGRVVSRVSVLSGICAAVNLIHIACNFWQRHYSYQVDQIGSRVKRLDPVPSLCEVVEFIVALYSSSLL